MRMLRRTPLKRGTKPLNRTAKPLNRGTRPLPKGRPINQLTEEKRKEMALEKEERLKMKLWFLEIWDEREDENGYCYCFETGKPMSRKTYREITACYDHVLEKEPFPQYKFLKKNIVIILPSVHAQKGMDVVKTPKINEYRKELLNLHKNGNLNV